MASTLKVYYDNGGSDNSPGTSTDVTAGGTLLRFRTDDSAITIDGVNPIPIPASGDNFSYWLQLYVKMTVRPGTEVVNNVKFYTDGTLGFGTGVTIYLGDQIPVHSSTATTGYDLATGTVGTTGDRMDSGANKHTDLTSRTDAFTFTSAAPFSMTIGETSSQMDAVNETTNYIVLQLDAGTTATAGTKTAETFTFRYDEV